MPRKRNAENKGLPARWRLAHGAYYFQVPPGLEASWDGKKLFRLGATLSEAYATWAQRIGRPETVNTVGALLDKYARDVVPTKPPKQQKEDARYLKRLRITFGHLPFSQIKPSLVYKFITESKGKTAGKRATAVLSHAFTMAVQWGDIDAHPFAREVKVPNNPPRTRYVTDEEIIEALALPSRRKKGSVLAIQAFIRIALLTGLRRGDLLRLKIADLQDDGIHVTPRKTENTTGKSSIYVWTDELRAAVEMAKAARPVDISPWLFCNKRGACYFNEEKGTASGWDSMWQRFMERVLVETAVKESFTEHDMRAKCASDAVTLEHARQLLAHADSRTTERFYRRKAVRVTPLR